MEKNEETAKLLLDKRIIKRLRIYIGITVVISAVIIYELLQGRFHIPWTITGVIIGLIIGIFVSRMFVLSWDDETNLIISHIDGIGAVILILYLIFVINKARYFGYWVHGTPLFNVILSVTAGTMIGRVLGTRRSIKQVIKALDILH